MSTVTAPILLDSTGQEISAKLQAIADAINGGTIDPLTVTENGTYTPSGTTIGYGPVTVDVQSGGGEVVVPKQVNFIDYDGTLLYSYTAQEANNLTALPENPAHDGLIAQGWNWTLAQIKTQLLSAPTGPMWVGQMYTTVSGDTEIDVSFPDDGRLSPILTIAVNGTVTVDWGDETSPNTVTGASLTTRLEVQHTYLASGDYTISIHSVSGTYTFYGSTSYPLLRKNTAENENYVYSSKVNFVRLGAGIESIGENAFRYCINLLYVTIPDTVTIIRDSAFRDCYGLRVIIVPNSATSLGAYCFFNCYSLCRIAVSGSTISFGGTIFGACYSLRSVTIPSGTTSTSSSMFSGCYAISSIAIPNTITTIGSSTFENCKALTSMNIPNSVTSIGDSAFYRCTGLSEIALSASLLSIGNNTFNSCLSLSSVTIPASVTIINYMAFNFCKGIMEYHLLPTTPPYASSPFYDASADLIIYVPAASLETYKTASGWSSYASKMVGE